MIVKEDDGRVTIETLFKGSQECPPLVLEVSVSETANHVLADAAGWLGEATDVRYCLVAIVRSVLRKGAAGKGAACRVGRIRLFLLKRTQPVKKDRMAELVAKSDANHGKPITISGACRVSTHGKNVRLLNLSKRQLERHLKVSVAWRADIREDQDFSKLRLPLDVKFLLHSCDDKLKTGIKQGKVFVK